MQLRQNPSSQITPPYNIFDVYSTQSFEINSQSLASFYPECVASVFQHRVSNRKRDIKDLRDGDNGGCGGGSEEKRARKQRVPGIGDYTTTETLYSSAPPRINRKPRSSLELRFYGLKGPWYERIEFCWYLLCVCVVLIEKLPSRCQNFFQIAWRLVGFHLHMFPLVYAQSRFPSLLIKRLHAGSFFSDDRLEPQFPVGTVRILIGRLRVDCFSAHIHRNFY